jgi:hypothetical protein
MLGDLEKTGSDRVELYGANDMEERNGTRSEDLVKPVSAGNLVRNRLPKRCRMLG